MPIEPSRDGQDGVAELQAKFVDLITGLDVNDLREVARQLMSGAGPATVQTGPRLERRRPRRPDEVTYRVRIDIKDAKPPIWRLELSSEMFLDEVHQVIQSAFGWTDSHLHRFASGPSAWDKSSELYLCPFDVEEGDDEDGIPEEDVRLDEVLVDVGDSLRYVYDYGDDWEHVVRLEAVLHRPADTARARCTDGRRAGPPEDCGGVWGYEELVAAGEVDGAEFEVEDVNASLSVALELAGLAATVPGPAGALLRQITGDPVEDDLAQLLRGAQLAEPVHIDPADASTMVGRYAWLLERVGNGGIRLTSAGYLPPRDVEAAMTELQMDDEWIGRGNREIQTLPVLELRESAQRMGLVRKRRGDLLLTRQAQKLRDDPVGLWWHLATRLSARDSQSIAGQAGTVTLIGIAAGHDIRSERFRAMLNGVLGALGWRLADGLPLAAWSGAGDARDTLIVFEHMGAFMDKGMLARAGVPTPIGRALARAALRGR